MSEPQALIPSGNVAFPVLAFDRHTFGTKQGNDELTIVWTCLIKSGWFNGLEIVDADGQAFTVAKTRIRGGVGFLWGWNPLYGRRVHVELLLRRDPGTGIVEVRERLMALLAAWPGWQSRDDYHELLATVRNATSVKQLIEGLRRLGL